MDLSNNLHADVADKAQQDISMLVAACASAVIVLVLVVITCICCGGKESERYGSLSDSRRDTVPLDDLLSKPSLADPESVFSEAGSYDLPRSTRASSWLTMSGEGSSAARESASMSGPSSDEKDQNNVNVVTRLNNTPDVHTKISVYKKRHNQSHAHVKSGKAAQTQEDSQLGPQQRHSSSPEFIPEASPVQIHSTVECAHLGDKFIYEVSASVKPNTGSPKTYSHKGISGKVGLDSTALKIHRDSITQEKAPFLSSARCSFSHEVGHIAHGNKVPRTSLPRTEEANDSHIQASSVSNKDEERTSEATQLSVQVGTEQTSSTSCSGTVVINGCGQMNSSGMPVGHGQTGSHHTSQQVSPHKETGNNPMTSDFTISDIRESSASCNTRPPNSNAKKDTNSDACNGDFDEYQHGRVTMRRCHSCVHGNEVCQEQLTKPRKKTFSLNLKIDVHFDNEGCSNENLPTFVCAPVSEYSKCGTSDSITKCTSSDVQKNRNEISKSRDTNTKLILLEKSFASKSNNTAIKPSVNVRKRRSEPMILENVDRKTCNARQFSRRFSEAESTSKTVPELTDNSTFNPGSDQNPDTNMAVKTDVTVADARSTSQIAEITNDAEEKPVTVSTSDGGSVQSELSGAIREETATELQLDTGYLNLEADKKDTQIDNLPNITNLQLSVVEADTLTLTSARSVGVGNIILKTSDDKIDVNNDNGSCEMKSVFKHSGLEGCQNSLNQRDINGEEETCISQKDTSASSSRNNTKYDKKVDSTNIESEKNSSQRQLNLDGTNKVTSSENNGGEATVEARNNDRDITKESVLFLPHSPPFTPSCDDLSHKQTEANSHCLDRSSRKHVLETMEMLSVTQTVAGEGTKKQNSEVSTSSDTYEHHKRALTMKERYTPAAALTTEVDTSRSQRASSLKMDSVNKRVQGSSLVCDSNQQRRKAMFFHGVGDETIKNPRSFGREIKARHNIESKLETLASDIKEETNVCPKEEFSIRDYRKNIAQLVDTLVDTQNKHKAIEDEAGKYGSRVAINSVLEDHDQSDVDYSNRSTSDISVQNEDSTSRTETSEISDDSDYDNPWDNLDNAVQRASIRYSRRPSRIAAGDTKTLLLKSAEDLGKLLEEADKRRQLRQTRNSCQVMPPENMMESMTIPFTRFSPHRHTVKGIVSQAQMSTSHSTEDILKTQTTTYPKLSLLRKEDEAVRSNKGVDPRRPMSLTSKVKAKITSPETKKRKK